jgi:hypothetical protein
MPSLPFLLSQLRAELERRRPKFARRLREGTAEQVVLEKLLERNLEPRIELLSWYQWTNGVVLGEGSGDPELIPGYLIPSFKRAFITYRSFALAPASERSDQLYWRDGWFPVLDDLAGGGLMLPAARHTTDSHVYILTEGSVSEAAFDTFEAMVVSIIECYRTGAYIVTLDEKLEEHSDLSREIYRKHNPNSPVWK